MAARDTPGVIAPPPLIFLGFLLAGWALSRLVGDPGLNLGPALAAAGFGPDAPRWLALGLVVAGLAVDMAAAGAFRRLGTRPEPWKPSTALAVDGLYRFSRNPMYLGFALIYAGFAVGMDSLAALVLLLPCMVTIDLFVVRREETYLAAKFGADYDAYRRRARRWL